MAVVLAEVRSIIGLLGHVRTFENAQLLVRFHLETDHSVEFSGSTFTLPTRYYNVYINCLRAQATQKALINQLLDGTKASGAWEINLTWAR